MSEYDVWAPVYDAWASDMTEDVAHYVSLAREADGPIVELMVGSHGWQERRVFERVAASLRPGGCFAFNAFAFSHTIAARLDGTTQDQHGVVHTLRCVVGREPFDDESLEFVYIARRP